jgi:hypothetical protein
MGGFKGQLTVLSYGPQAPHEWRSLLTLLSYKDAQFSFSGVPLTDASEQALFEFTCSGPTSPAAAGATIIGNVAERIEEIPALKGCTYVNQIEVEPA